MAKKTANPLQNRFDQALQNHAGDETVVRGDFTNLPPGARGVAQLTEIKFGSYQRGTYQGEEFVRFAGTVVTPKDNYTYVPKAFIDGKVQALPPVTMKIMGLQTSMMVAMCDTKNGKGEVTTLDEHIETLLNELRKLGADTREIASRADLEAVIEALVDEAPYFKYSTSSRLPTADYPEEGVWENWNGQEGLEDFDAEVDEAAGVEEEEAEEGADAPVEEEEETLEDMAARADAWENAGQTGEGEDAATELTNRAEGCGLNPLEYGTWAELAEAIEGNGSGFGEEEEEAEAEEEEEDLEALGAAADDGDQDAIDRLTELCTEAGIDPESIPTWAEVPAALAEGGEDEEEEQVEPEKGDVMFFKPQGARKAVEVEVTTVNKAKQTCTVKRLDTGKAIANVAWDKLSVE